MKYFVFIAFTALVLVSCVTKSTHEAMIAERDMAATSRDSLKSVVTYLNTELMDAKGEISKLQKELELMKENYKRLKENTAEGAIELINKLEKMQREIAEREAKIEQINRKLKERDNILNSLREKIQTAMAGVEEGGLSVYIKDGRLYVSMSNKLLFKSGSTNINEEGQEALMTLSDVVNREPEINILVEGHTDNQMVSPGQRFKDNWDLSVLRATEVTRFLSENGNVDPTRVIASGRSEYFPIQPGDDAGSRAVNRRTEIIITPNINLFQILGEK